MLVLYLDESGDHSLTKIDPQFPMFALAGCLFEDAYHDTIATSAMSEYKQRLFGYDTIILHTADITRNANGFERLKDSDFRRRFYGETNRLIDSLDFTIIAATIRKDLHLAKYANPENPYHYCLECILERFFFVLESRNLEGLLIAESRNQLFDRQLNEVFQWFMERRTTYVSGSRLQRRVKGLEFIAKKANITGLQVADLVVTPIARHVLGKKTHEDFEIVSSKFRRRADGNYLGWGLKVLP